MQADGTFDQCIQFRCLTRSIPLFFSQKKVSMTWYTPQCVLIKNCARVLFFSGRLPVFSSVRLFRIKIRVERLMWCPPVCHHEGIGWSRCSELSDAASLYRTSAEVLPGNASEVSHHNGKQSLLQPRGAGPDQLASHRAPPLLRLKLHQGLRRPGGSLVGRRPGRLSWDPGKQGRFVTGGLLGISKVL